MTPNFMYSGHRVLVSGVWSDLLFVGSIKGIGEGGSGGNGTGEGRCRGYRPKATSMTDGRWQDVGGGGGCQRKRKLGWEARGGGGRGQGARSTPLSTTAGLGMVAGVRRWCSDGWTVGGGDWVAWVVFLNLFF